MKHENENALPEAATPEQSKQVKPLYMDSSISDLITQVIGLGVDLIRFAGEGKRRFTIFYGGIYLSIWEMNVKDDGSYEFVRDLVDILIDASKGEKLISELSDAVQMMCREVGTVREELGYGKE